jgi:hypothetical protein
MTNPKHRPPPRRNPRIPKKIPGKFVLEIDGVLLAAFTLGST